MPTYMIYIILIVIIAIVGWLYISKVLKNKTGSSSSKITVDVDAIIDALGGIANIETMEATNSKVSFFVKEIKKVKAEELKVLGATGIVQSNRKITAIFGKVSAALVEAIKAKR